MQTLSSVQFNALDDIARNPTAEVTIQRNYDSIPFTGKFLQSTSTNEKYPKHFLHTDGRLCLVFSKYLTTKNQLYFKTSDITRASWNACVGITSGTSYNWLNPASIQINSSNDIGIIVSRNGTDLYSCIINTSGVIQTAMSDTTINGTSPSLIKIGTTYWLVYEASGILYYRTCTDFSTWSAATNLNTITSLSNDHSKAYIYYDTSSKLWLTFERVTDASASPEVKNVYTMLSNDNGANWDSPVQQTTLVAGEGSALTPSLVDITSHRYLSYTIERQIQNHQDTFGDTNRHNYFVVDETNNRVGMITGVNYANGNYLCIYDRTAGTYTNHDLKAHGLTAAAPTCLGYDEDNKIWVIGTPYDGIIVYDETNITWTTYNESSSPAILGNNVINQIMAVEDKKVYLVTFNLSNNYKLQKLDLTAGTNTQLSTLGSLHALYQINTFLSSSYVVCIIRANTVGGYHTYHPTVYVINKSTDTELYNEKMSDGSQYNCSPSTDTASNSNYGYAQFAFDEVNNIIYALATDTNETDDSGIIKYTVGDSALTFSKYYSQLDANPTGLLPSPDQTSGKVAFINGLVYNSTNTRLYIEVYATSGAAGGVGDHVVSILNTSTDLIVENYASTNSDAWATNWSAIDADLIKVLPLKTWIFFNTTSMLACTDDKEFIFYTDKGFGDRYFWNILTTEGVGQRVYYRKTIDDSSWTTATYLTLNSKDTYINLGYSDSRLKAFWQREVDGVTELKWDEDLGAPIDISEYVHSFEINMSDETGANDASVSFADKEGLFNPLNYNSLRYDYLLENNIIAIKKGNAGGTTPAFTGLIGSGNSVYTRGAETLYNVKLYDKSKNWFKRKITSSFYESQTIDYIVEDIITTYGDLGAADYDLPTLGDTIPKVQFIEEYVMDILYKLYQAYEYFPYFDESGILKARKVDYSASTDFTYYKEGTDSVAANKAPALNIIEFNHNWSDDTFVNKVTVIGQTEETFETDFEEEYMGSIQGAAGWFSTTNTFDFYFSTDKTMYCKEPRLSVTNSCGNKFFGGGESLATAGAGKQKFCRVHQNVTNLTVALYACIAGSLLWTFLWGEGMGVVSVYNGLAPVLAIALTIIGQISNFIYEIHAKPIGEAAPKSIEETVQDTDLITKYGEIEKEIDNPFLDTSLKCRNLANFELQKASWFRYQPELKIISNMAHQTQDIINVYNPVTDISYKMYIREIRRSYTRGVEDICQINAALIT